MSFIQIVFTLLIMPLQILFETIYSMAYSIIDNPGLTIIVLSISMNILVLPLYRRADAMQEKERNLEMKLHRGVQHIKKTFHGDEQMLMLQTYYRQNDYKPVYVLRGAVSLFLEIPFFIAAYRFLSNLSLLNGVSFGPIADLGKADAMLVVGGFTINILPIIMTLINFISAYIFTKGYPAKTKVQLFGMAVFFLVFLYDSPAGLVFYWTLNNIFSLVKTIFYKLRNPRKILKRLVAIIGVFILFFGLFLCPIPTMKVRGVICGFGILLEIPVLFELVDRRFHLRKEQSKLRRTNQKMFFLSCLFLAILEGVLIPSAVIASSPQEFMILGFFSNPIWYIVSATCLSVGLFVIWLGIFYGLMNEQNRVFFEYCTWILCGIAVVEYMVFGNKQGTLNSTLQYIEQLEISSRQEIQNLLILIGVAGFAWILYHFYSKRVFEILVIGTFALCIIAGANVMKIHRLVNQVTPVSVEKKDSLFSLSTTGQNVIMIMLDRAMGEYIPYMFKEKPELEEQFAGFTLYSNVVSFGSCTNIGSPGLYGGYEYTPIELNKRDQELLQSKQDEALKVMPVIFDQNGYEVTVCDPTYAGYQMIPDLSIYDDYPDISTYITIGQYMHGSTSDNREQIVSDNMRNFFYYSIMNSMPLCVHDILYDGGGYNSNEKRNQECKDMWRASGINNEFMKSYGVLNKLPELANITADDCNTFLMLSNDTTHEPCLLQTPDYLPMQEVDNEEYYSKSAEWYEWNGNRLKLEDEEQMKHYQINMAAMLQLGNFFKTMREFGVYDNTRIIIVSDHGRPTGQIESIMSDPEMGDLERFFPILLVKDFGASEFCISDEFMTNADVPTLAFADLIDNPVNPFTGKTIDNSEKTSHAQFIFASNLHDILENNGTTFKPGDWYSVQDNVWDRNNWKLVKRDAALPYD